MAKNKDKLNKDKLKPCPFCGSKKIIVYDLGNAHIYNCQCEDCYASTRTSASGRILAIFHWNRRVK